MAHGILIQNKVAAQNLDIFNRSAKSEDAVDNGFVFQLATRSSDAGEGEVYVATKPATGALSELWMACSPELVTIVSGNSSYRGLDPNPANFVNAAGKVFDAYKPAVGDIITVTADALTGTKGANTFVVAADATYKLTWASAAISGLSYKLVGTTYISIADGSIGTQRVTAYMFECVAIR